MWNPSFFGNLRIPIQQKEIIQALSNTYLSQNSHPILNNFILGKGRKLITLLQYITKPSLIKSVTPSSTKISKLVGRPVLVRP